jgi:hypothetical protein
MKGVQFDLWYHPEPGRSVVVGPVGAVGPVETVGLYSVIPHGQLWRHVLTVPGSALHVYANSIHVATQEYHSKTNPYFYIDLASLVTIQVLHHR